MFPYLDLVGFKRRTLMSAAEVDYVEQDSPGFVATRIAVRSSYINGRLRKRYGDGDTNSLPLGQAPAPLLVAGTSPAPALSGRPTLGSIQLQIVITTGGALGAAAFKWSTDGGNTFPNIGVLTASTVVLGTTGITASFAAGTYNLNDVMNAATPVPEIVLGWLTTLVTSDTMRKRGVNPQDPGIDMLRESVNQVESELKEAADSKEGLWDLPSTEDSDSAVTTGGPLGYSDASPYGWQMRQASNGEAQDENDTFLVVPTWPWSS